MIEVDTPLPRRTTGPPLRTASALRAVVAVIATAVLIGWFFRVPRLTTVFPGLVSMKPNTALCLLLLSLAPAMRLRWRAAVSTFVLGVGVTTLTEVELGAHWRTDLLVPGTGLDWHQAQMAPATAACLTLLASATLGGQRAWHRWQRTAALICLVVSWVAVIGYLYGASSLYTVASYSSMALHTALSLALLAVATLLASPDAGLVALARDRGQAGRITRVFVPFLTVGAPLLGWLRLEAQRAGWFDTNFGVAGLVTALTLSGLGLVARTAGQVRLSEQERDAAQDELAVVNRQLESLVTTRTDALHDISAQFRAAFDSSPLGLAVATREGTVRTVNRMLVELTRRPSSVLVGGQVQSWFADERDGDDAERLATLLVSGSGSYQVERQLRTTSAVTWVSVTVACVQLPHGRLGLLYQLEDVTRRKLAEDRARHMSLHDALTDLPNRLLLMDRLEQALAQAGRHDGGVGVLFLDLDRFKVINDSLGHDAGDQVLKEVSRRLRAAARAGDTVARLGGDEFVVICPDVSSADDALRVALALHASLSEPILVGAVDTTVEASIGVAYGIAHDDPELLLRQADQAMYRAKDQGRSRLEVFSDDLRTRISQRLDVELSLRGATARGEIETWFQPIVDVETGEMTAAEALVRWRRPGGGVVQPDAFVHVAEEVGLIKDIGLTVLHAACHAAAAQPAGPVVSVNVSARQFVRADFKAVVLHALAESGLPPDRLWLELTESAVVEAIDSAARSFQTLRDQGVRIAIDDFGTGFSSFAHLKNFRVDLIKIDGMFVNDMLRSEHDFAVVSGIVNLAAALHLEVVAEAIETPEQLDSLRQLGCRFGQGFLFAEPGPVLARQLPSTPSDEPRPRIATSQLPPSHRSGR